MKSEMAIAAALATALLAGCASSAASRPGTPAVSIFLRKNATRATPMTRIPASLGLLVPRVADYRCSGDFQPAATVQQTATTPPADVAPPFWQLTLQCVNPELKFHLPKDTIPPGVVWIFELPANHDATTLRQAIGAVADTVQLGLSHEGSLQVGVGKLGFAGKMRNLVWFLGGKTSWTFVHTEAHGRVLVYLTGRAVSTATLKTFAQSMRRLSR